ncbi:MAG TPA: hypothetical protein VMT37_13785 [Solirubrobacterales bacterium]|nr:hypothetical protein [Solirubrobacterales bacterium]
MKPAWRPSKLLYHDFPVEIRQFYGDLFIGSGGQPLDWRARHARLIELVEMTTLFFGSLALSDYRSRHEPEPKVEDQLEKRGNRNLPLGYILELFRSCCEVTPEPLFPPPKAFPVRRMESVERFVAAFDAIGEAVKESEGRRRAARIDIAQWVDRGPQGASGSVGWWTGWRRILEYRNKVAHPDGNGWPTGSRNYWEIMTPLLHDAVAELLIDPTVYTAVVNHPVVALTFPPEYQDSGGFKHYVYVDDHGQLREEEIEAEGPVIERWRDSFGEANMASSFLLERTDEGWAFRGVFWDLRNGLPPAIRGRSEAAATQSPARRATARGKKTVLREGRGVAPGTCGELAQGVLSDGTPFHITCPINKSATVQAELRPAERFSVDGLRKHHRKLSLAVKSTAQELDLGPVEVSIRHWSDIDIGKGMGSSTADVVAGIRAIADAAGERLDPTVEGRLAAAIESSDGSMFPGISVVNHQTCELVRSWDWHPEFVIVMLVPTDSVDTSSIGFDGQLDLASEYDDLLANVDRAIAERSIEAFAQQSTRSAVLNNYFLLNPYASRLAGRLDELGALGLDVGHTGTVCGLLFPNSDEGRVSASDACFEVRRQFPELKDVKVVTTPRCSSGSRK